MTTTTRIRPCGEAALLLDCADLSAAVGLAERIENAQTGAVDVVAAARTVLVTVRQPSELPQLRRVLEALLDSSPNTNPLRNSLPSDRIRYPYGSSESASRVADSGEVRVGADAVAVVTIDVRYDGPDLADVAALAGLSIEALVRRHTSITWRAAFGGFAPGFFYLVDDRELEASAAGAIGAGGAGDATQAASAEVAADAMPTVATDGMPAVPADAMPTVPRLGSPRPRVSAGSVAVADRFCAVYPGASPGGWRLLGTTDAPMWDVDRPQPGLLAPGTLVRFRDLGSEPRGSGEGGGRPGRGDASRDSSPTSGDASDTCGDASGASGDAS